MITGYEKVSTTEQDFGLQHDGVRPAFDASVDHTDAPKGGAGNLERLTLV
jgi:hypothetical protein